MGLGITMPWNSMMSESSEVELLACMYPCDESNNVKVQAIVATPRRTRELQQERTVSDHGFC
jgi:hypothetical protein